MTRCDNVSCEFLCYIYVFVVVFVEQKMSHNYASNYLVRMVEVLQRLLSFIPMEPTTVRYVQVKRSTTHFAKVRYLLYTPRFEYSE